MKKIIVFIIGALVVKNLSAHELTESRATLILRDQTHITANIYIDYSRVLHHVLMPEKKYAEFLLIYAGLKSEEFEQTLVQVQKELQSEIKIAGNNGSKLSEGVWYWPSATDVQKSIREQAMQLMVDPTAHINHSISEIHTDMVATQKIESVNIQFPHEFDKVLVVSYQPNQVWVEANSPAKAIVF